MKRILVALGMLLLGASIAGAQRIDLTYVTDLHPSGAIKTGEPVTFMLNWNNGPDTIIGWTSGFRFYMVGGGARSAVSVDEEYYVAQAQAAGQDGGQYVNTFSVNGTGADTIGLGAFRIFEIGMLPYHNDTIAVFTVTVDTSSHLDVFCIDSCRYPPTNRWVWAAQGSQPRLPAWAGPHCFTCVLPDWTWICGDVNFDAHGPNIVDLNYLVQYLYAGGPPPPYPPVADINGADGVINIVDLTQLVEYMFSGGAPPDCGW